MIDYELCKELRESGFPQNPHRHNERPNSWIHRDGTYHDWDGAGDDEECYVPTLEELIAACPSMRGESRLIVVYGDDEFKFVGWIAGYNKSAPYEGNGIELEFMGFGETPAEAVARLYLSLNKKQ